MLRCWGTVQKHEASGYDWHTPRLGIDNAAQGEVILWVPSRRGVHLFGNCF